MYFVDLKSNSALIFFIFDPSDIWVNRIRKLGGCDFFFRLGSDLLKGEGAKYTAKKYLSPPSKMRCLTFQFQEHNKPLKHKIFLRCN